MLHTKVGSCPYPQILVWSGKACQRETFYLLTSICNCSKKNKLIYFIIGRDSCNGDSGGPLVGRIGSGRSSTMYLYGVVSFGSNSCDGTNPGDNVKTFLLPFNCSAMEIACLMLTLSAQAKRCPQGILTTL